MLSSLAAILAPKMMRLNPADSIFASSNRAAWINIMTPTVSSTLPDRLLKLEQVMNLVALGKTMVYRLVSEGRFPQPFKPGGNATRWSEREVFAWMTECGGNRPAGDTVH
jgi:prophage regulatory protein